MYANNAKVSKMLCESCKKEVKEELERVRGYLTHVRFESDDYPVIKGIAKELQYIVDDYGINPKGEEDDENE